MSSERDAVYYPQPPPPPLLPLLMNNIPQLSNPCAVIPLTGNCTLVSLVAYQCIQTPEEELLAVRNRLWDMEGTQESPAILCYRHIKPVLQDGPKCGLVALSMASSCTSQPLSVEHLFQEAHRRGFTNHGEMFSVDDMATLARDMFHQSCRQVEILSGGLGQDRSYVLNQLMQGSILLIPYDADANHAPCCRQGHKAHWAVVSGVVSSALPEQMPHLVARQGKSRHLALWPYDELQRSNENLMELDPGRAVDGRTYVLPPGGVAAGLQGRAILLHELGLDQPVPQTL
ncbi:actin maturation protease [Anabrus simplex]|uniref:actin maturation protease n=1 Tax=Anabrus simplex TaxID=316456 RepID=UPI0035A32F02